MKCVPRCKKNCKYHYGLYLETCNYYPDPHILIIGRLIKKLGCLSKWEKIGEYYPRSRKLCNRLSRKIKTHYLPSAIEKQIPLAISEHCYCGHEILTQCYIYNRVSKEIKTVGSVCINKFMEALNQCQKCNRNHRNTSVDLCNICRNIYSKCSKCFKYYKNHIENGLRMQILQDICVDCI